MSTPPLKRCPWLDVRKADYVAYHDNEWGVPCYEDAYLYEMLLLETMQAGLSWYTVLKKRPNYRLAFDNFNPELIARYDAQKVTELMNNAGLIRHRLKIAASISNAQHFLTIQQHYGSFANYLWQFKPPANASPIPKTLSDYPSHCPESAKLSQDLRKRGFKFLGSTTCYAYMQAVGLINNHSRDCFCR